MDVNDDGIRPTFRSHASAARSKVRATSALAAAAYAHANALSAVAVSASDAAFAMARADSDAVSFALFFFEAAVIFFRRAANSVSFVPSVVPSVAVTSDAASVRRTGTNPAATTSSSDGITRPYGPGTPRGARARL